MGGDQKDIPPDRAPGPDGFTGVFYRSSWSVIRDDVMAPINALLFSDSRAFHRLNSALIILLPKWPDASAPTDYRPITMIHSVAKMVSKILAMRLAPRMNELVSTDQNAFIRGRSIHDNYKYVQRTAVLYRKRKVPRILLKLDVSKAFDTLSWPFLLEVLQALGFGNNWRRWITTLLSTASSRILLNGQPGRPIIHRRGVRQGDSLSPLLFILAMEVLSRLFARAQEEGVLRGMSQAGIKFQCSIYAEAIILFAHPDEHEATAIKEILAIFREASGLRTNLAKCSITNIFGAAEHLAAIRDILECWIAELPIRYLGLPLSTSKIPKAEIRRTRSLEGCRHATVL